MKTIKKEELFREIGGVLRVKNLKSTRSGRSVANQLEITFMNGVGFTSYGALIAVCLRGQLFLTQYHDFSRTTSKYATQWTGYTTVERRKGIEEGKFIFVEQ